MRCGVIRTGDGTVRAAHGILPVPAPATLKLLEGHRVSPGPEGAGELVTPTGAALVRVLSTGAPPAEYVPRRSGFGAGTKDFPGRANALRIVLADVESRGRAGRARDGLAVAADVDDMSPEYLAAVADRAASRRRARRGAPARHDEEGARRGRGSRCSAVRRTPARFEALLLRETTHDRCPPDARSSRTVLPREERSVDVLGHSVRVKVVTLPTGNAGPSPSSTTSSASHWRRDGALSIFTSLLSRRNAADERGVPAAHAGIRRDPFPGDFQMAVFVRILPAAALLVATATSLQAQATAASQPVCEASQPGGSVGARANLSLQLAMKDQKTNPANAAKNLQAAVKTLEPPAKGEELDRAYMLGSALALWLNQPSVGYTPKRSVVGFSANPEATIDLPSTIDSLFKIVEASKPGCSYYTAYWRGGQQAYLDMVNNGIAALNADKLDSAVYYASMANKLYSGSPYGAMVLGNIANKKNNNEEAVKYWQAAATAAATDTVVSRRPAPGARATSRASTSIRRATRRRRSAAQVEAAKKAADAYAQLIAIPGTRGTYLYGGRQNLPAGIADRGRYGGARPRATPTCSRTRRRTSTRTCSTPRSPRCARIATPMRPSCSRTCCRRTRTTATPCSTSR